MGFLGGLLLDILAFALLVESSFDGFAIICGAAAAINVLGLILGFLTGRRSFALGIIVNIALAAVPFLAIGACLHWVESGI